jgi:hypothetical protein
MKLDPITFHAIYADGLVELQGHAFEVNGRKMVVHKVRPLLAAIDKAYKISEANVGFAVRISPTNNRAEAVRLGSTEVQGISEESWQAFIKSAEKFRVSLSILEE